jgi:4-hydroxythreonine-4-phosphate dehydrogenase
MNPDRLGGPLLAITLGDPAGIGPEIVARTLAATRDDPMVPLVVGDVGILRRAADLCQVQLDLNVIEHPTEAGRKPGAVDVIDVGVAPADLPFGEVSAVAGRAALAAIETAARAAMAGYVDGMVTAPINKEAIWAAGSQHLGHTELLGELTGTSRYNTMFVVRGLKIFFTTRHLALRDALDQVTVGSVGTAIKESWVALEVLGHAPPRLAVAAINPHGGEGGAFGREEIDVLVPACEAARAGGMAVIGPVPADSVFHLGLQGAYDGVLSHYHDQGHIAAKTLDFEGAITVTMGLPILRTSVDHGTAFDIAGTGKASHRGMLESYRAAGDLARHRERLRAVYGTQVAT